MVRVVQVLFSFWSCWISLVWKHRALWSEFLSEWRVQQRWILEGLFFIDENIIINDLFSIFWNQMRRCQPFPFLQWFTGTASYVRIFENWRKFWVTFRIHYLGCSGLEDSFPQTFSINWLSWNIHQLSIHILVFLIISYFRISLRVMGHFANFNVRKFKFF